MLKDQPQDGQTVGGLVVDAPTPPAFKRWAYEGIVLESKNDGVSVDDLLEFALYARQHYPNERVRLHEFGLRVTACAAPPGDSHPHLEWRDWD